MVCFEKFVRPAILKMLGSGDLELPVITAELKADIKKRDNRRHFVRASVTCEEGKYYALPTKSQSSGGLMSMVVANALIVVPEGVQKIAAGSQVQVEMLKAVKIHAISPGSAMISLAVGE
ncbi:MAG: molybdopterin molybdenumtransferase MoeA, partial [Candidatus Desantisbacteria bacterium]